MARRRQWIGQAHRYVDMWAFMGVHPSNLEILRRLKMADDRQFGANMDLCGTVSEKDDAKGSWNQSHVIGIRSDIWNPAPEKLARKCESLQERRRGDLRKRIRAQGPLNQEQTRLLAEIMTRDPVMRMRPSDLESRRLVLKLFKSTGTRIQWQGSLEEMVTRELHNSLGTNGPVLSFSLSLGGFEFLTSIQENRRWLRIPSIFSFCYHDEERERLWFVEIRRKWVSVGIDFRIIADGRQIGEIDGALIGFGYNAYISIDDPILADDPRFADLLTLFTASVGYQKTMRAAVRRRMIASRAGLPSAQLIEAEEFGLLRNPRVA